MIDLTTAVVNHGKDVMDNPSLGDQELEVLRYIAENAPLSVGEVAAQYGEPRGLARTTVLTVMERLRRKGFLGRKKVQGIFRYAPQVAQADVMKELVRGFVEKTLAGSLTPFVAYLSEPGRVTDVELASLRQLVESLPRGKEKR